MIKIRNEELLREFGVRLRNLRRERNMSQEKLANLAEITISQVSRIERGEVNPTLSTLDVIAKSIGVSRGELIEF